MNKKYKHGLTFGMLCIVFWACSSPKAIQLMQKQEYSMQGINVELLENADVLTRYSERKIEFIDQSEATTTVRFSKTVLNKEGRDEGYLKLGYDQFHEIEYVRGTLRDINGNLIRSLTKEDTNDLKATNSISLYDDNRVKTYSLYHGSYPYTVEYEYKIRHHGHIGFSNIRIQGFREGVEEARFEVVYPKEMKINHLVEHADPRISETSYEGTIAKLFVFQDLTPIQNEELGPPSSTYLPQLSVSPNQFQIEGTTGSLVSWEEFGKWYYSLSKGRQKLPDNIKADVDRLVEGVEDDREKLKLLYHYHQEKIRYVSVQLGIGGWQPFNAAYVAKNQYGDCKALTNFMKSLADYVGITTYPVLINSGLGSQHKLNPDFPSNVFNHVVLMAPLPGDTLWMENTSSITAFGNVGLSNEDRYALAITPDGGRLVQTPAKPFYENKQINIVRHEINHDGSARTDIQTTFTGNQQERIRHLLSTKNDTERDKWLRNSINLNNATLVESTFSDPSQKNRTYDLSFNVHVSQFATHTGSRLFIPLNSLNKWDILFSDFDEREHDIFVPFTFEDHDSTTIRIPDGYEIESMPSPVRIENEFISYFSDVRQQDNRTFVYTRRFGLKQKRISKEKFDEADSIFRKIWKSDRSKLVVKEL